MAAVAATQAGCAQLKTGPSLCPSPPPSPAPPRPSSPTLATPLPPPAPFPPLQSCRRSGTPRRSGMCRHGTLTPTRIPWWVLRRGAVGCCWELWVRVGSACRRHRQLHLAHRCRLPCRERGSAGLWPLQSRRFKPWRHLSRLPSIPLGCKPHPAAIPCPPVLPCPALPFR